MVPIIERLNYRSKLLETPKIKAFLYLIENSQELPSVTGQTEADSFFYECVRALKSDNGAEFSRLYNDFSRREPDERAPFVRDEYLLFVLLCCIEKFSANKSWLKKVLECRRCSTEECTHTTETFKALLQGDTQNKSNLIALVVLFQSILKRPLPRNELVKEMYTKYMQTEFPFYKSDFLTLTVLKSLDIFIIEADMTDNSQFTTLKTFEALFLKRTSRLASYLYYIVITLTIGSVIFLYLKYKDQIDSLNTILGFLGLAGLSLPAVLKKESVSNYFQTRIRKRLGYKQ